MNVQGFIKEIYPPREWTSKDNQVMQTYPVVIELPYIDSYGKERSDEIVADLTATNPDYIARLGEAITKKEKMDFSLVFSVREYQGKVFQGTKIVNSRIIIGK